MDIQGAKAEFNASKSRLQKAWSLLIGSRVTAAAALMFAIAFGTTIIVSPPERLPPLGVLSPVQAGLPIGIDLEKERALLTEAGQAAERQGIRDRGKELIEEFPAIVPIVNWGGLALSLGVLIVTLILQARAHARGARPL